MRLSSKGPSAETKSSCAMDYACHRSLDPEEVVKGREVQSYQLPPSILAFSLLSLGFHPKSFF